MDSTQRKKTYQFEKKTWGIDFGFIFLALTFFKQFVIIGVWSMYINARRNKS